MNVSMILYNDELLFELYSTCMAMGYFKYTKGKKYPRKDLIERLINNATVDIIPLKHKRFINIDNVRKLITISHCEHKQDFIQWLKENKYIDYNEVFDCERKETIFFNILGKVLNPIGYELKTQYFENHFRYDGYIEKLDLVIEYDENNHANYNPDLEKYREKFIKSNHKYLIRISDLQDVYYNIGIVMKQVMSM